MAGRNRELAVLFERIADAYELKGENGFRTLSYRRAARVLLDLAEDVAALDAGDRLETVDGIGRGIAAKIHEYLATGKMKKLAEVTAGLPDGLFELLTLQGLGPKGVKLLYDRLQVSSVADLKQALRSGAVAGLPGFGVKKAANLGRALKLHELSGERMYLNEATELAAGVTAFLDGAPAVGRCTAAGSLRRGRETVGDIDILATGRSPQRVVERFLGHPDITEILARGSTKASALFRTPAGPRQVDLRVVPAPSWGAALQYFTGSAAHNVALRGLARDKGLKLSEYGVFRGNRKVAGRTEEEVYRALGLAPVEPELREDRGEVAAAAAGGLPGLVEPGDIRADLHVHTSESDGSATIEQMVAECRRLGYTHLAVTEHSASAGYAGGLDNDGLERLCDRVDRLNAKLRGFRVLKGSEVDITPDGGLDYPDRLLARLDVVVCSIHQAFRKNATERMCGAIDHPLTSIIGHPTGRIIGRREGYDIDIEKVIDAAARRGKVLEINSFYGRLDLSDVRAREALRAGVKLAVNTDAHSVVDLGWMKYGVTTARRAWATRDDIINCLTLRRLLALLQKMRRS